MSNLYRKQSIDDSYQVSVHLAKRFQRRRFSQKSTNQKQELHVTAMFVNGSEQNKQLLQRIFHRCSLSSFGSFGQAVSEKRIFQKSANQKQKLPVVAMFVNGSLRNKQSLQRTFHRCFRPSFGSFGQAVSEKRIFQKSTNQKQELSVAAMFAKGQRLNEQTLQSTFHKCFLPNFGLYGHAVTEEMFRNQPIKNKNCLWRPCLLTDRNKLRNLYRGLSIDASYQVSVHFSSGVSEEKIKI